MDQLPAAPLLSLPFLLRPFASADAPAFAAAVRESTSTVGRWTAWAHAGCSEDEALAGLRTLARYAFDELNLSRVEIVVADGKLPSRGVARKAGAVWECLARKRLQLHGEPVAAHMLSLVPGDVSVS